jgi:hypothetical protein
MNAFYNWNNDEIMITERMKDIQRDADKMRLLKAAGLSKASLFERVKTALQSALIKLRLDLQQNRSHGHEARPAVSGKHGA